MRYLDSVGIESIEQHEHELTAYALTTLSHMPGVRIIGPESSVDRGSAISFVVDGLHPRCRAGVGRPGCGGAGGPPLRVADVSALRGSRDDTAVHVPLQRHR